MTTRTRSAIDWALIGVIAITPICAMFVYWLSAIIWLPDLASPDAERVIARSTIDGGESLELTQRWVGDGYLTGVRHRLRDGTSLFAVGDGDAPRAFRGRVSLNTNDSSVTFQFSGQRWRYYWRLRSLSVGDGQSRDAT